MTPDGWYKTGDLGFLDRGEVFVTGRKKDLIIIQGRNFYPTDVETVAGSVPGVAPGRVVAFGATDESSGTEQLVVLAESDDVKGPAKALELRIRSAISQELGCTASVVRIVPPRYLIKSTAGKIARGDNKKKWLEAQAAGGAQ